MTYTLYQTGKKTNRNRKSVPMYALNRNSKRSGAFPALIYYIILYSTSPINNRCQESFKWGLPKWYACNARHRFPESGATKQNWVSFSLWKRLVSHLGVNTCPWLHQRQLSANLYDPQGHGACSSRVRWPWRTHTSIYSSRPGAPPLQLTTDMVVLSTRAKTRTNATHKPAAC